MILKKHIIYVFLLLVSCSPKYVVESHSNKVIKVESEADSNIINIITPYEKEIKNKMNEVLSFTKNDLIEGQPQGTLGNFVTDLCLEYNQADICIMNNGGLRSNIYQGEITREEIYTLMPFENELVIINLNREDYIELLNYIAQRGGEPFAGMTIKINQKGEVLDNSWPVKFEEGEKVRVITSDYLANGGDNMKFLENKEQIEVGIKLRDAIINYCTKVDTIDVHIDNRIIIEE